MLGIATLLLLIVHVNRETLQVVSLAMTGLMRDAGRDFHKGSKVSKFQGFRVSKLVIRHSAFGPRTSGVRRQIGRTDLPRALDSFE